MIGSPDLPAYVEALEDRIGTPSLVVCLDSGCIDDERLWVTTSLRSLVSGILSVDIVTEGLHSGDAAEAADTADEIGRIADHCPFVDGARPTTDDPTDQLLARTWHPTLSVIGADGMPPTARAGNVLRPSTALKLSLRLPPTCDPAAALDAVRSTLEADPPYGASGSFPFMGMLGERFPEAQSVITGLLGPDANAHGPNEYLHLPTARRVTMTVAHLLEAHASR